MTLKKRDCKSCFKNQKGYMEAFTFVVNGVCKFKQTFYFS